MLGIRQYKSVAIDLWQGDESQFYCDLLARDLKKGLAQAHKEDKRHLVYAPVLSDLNAEEVIENARKAMSEIKDFIDKREENSYPQRITLAFDQHEPYLVFQEGLFSNFPDF